MKKPAILKRPWPALAVLAALALGGCSGGNIGSSWQCPLAQGGTCDSVAGADPAVPEAAPGPGAAHESVPREPLYRVREERPAAAAAPCRADCDGGFDPFGWLARLFGMQWEDDTPPEAKPAPEIVPAPVAAGFSGDPDVEAPTGPATGTLPAEPQAAPDDREDDLRTDEVVARIWIAPFVDGSGVYREASHVRVVLEPAGWRLP